MTFEILGGRAVDVAPRLLGWIIRTVVDGEPTALRLLEVEAYGGADDPASHAHRGLTARNRSMFSSPGTLYVYRSYGVHWCANVVIGAEGEGSAVLLRAGEPVEGEAVMRRRRGRPDHLADGPGKLTQALGITGVHDATSLRDGPVRLLPDELPPGTRVEATPRVGITRAVELPWRFVARLRG